MITMITPQQGQSNYDLVLQTIGGFDSFISYLNSNGLALSSVPPTNPIPFNSNNIQSRTISGYPYASYSYAQTLSPLLNNDGTPLLNNDGQPLYNN